MRLKFNLRAEAKSSIIADILDLSAADSYAARIANQSFMQIESSSIHDQNYRGLLTMRGSLIISANNTYSNITDENISFGGNCFLDSDGDTYSGTTSSVTANTTYSSNAYFYQN